MTISSKVIKVLNKLFEAGYTNEKDIAAMTMDEMLSLSGISMLDMVTINDLQKSIKANKVISFLSGIVE